MESESDPLTRLAVDLFEKEPLKGNSEVHLHTLTKFGEDRSKDLGGDREQTDRQTNRQTDKRCSIYSMIYNIVESESDPLTRRAVDLFEKEPLKGNSEVHLHTPTKFGEDRSKDLGGDREQTDRQTNRQTDKRCSIYSMMWTYWKMDMAHIVIIVYIQSP